METINEHWKPVVGYENLYEVSSIGRVRNTHYWSCHQKLVERRPYRLMKLETTQDGYKRVVLTKSKKSRHYSVHRLVAMAFIPNPERLPQINHIDEDPANNEVVNLEWCTGKQNCNHGQHKQKIALRQTNNSYRSKPVSQFDKEGNLIHTYPSTREAERETGIACEQISRCCKGRNHHAGGFRWKYAGINSNSNG